MNLKLTLFGNLLLCALINLNAQSINPVIIHDPSTVNPFPHLNDDFVITFPGYYYPLESEDNLLDSIVSIDDSKIIYSYNTDGLRTSSSNHVWCEDSLGWIPRKQTEYSYDENGNRVLEYTEKQSSGVWVMADSVVSEFDERGNRTKYERYGEAFFNSEYSGVSYINSYSTYLYDSNNNILENINYSWNTTTNDWQENSKMTYAYNQEGLETLKTWYSYDTTSLEWTPSTKWVKEYNEETNPILEESYSYRNDTWVGTSKSNYEYDTQNRRTGIVNYSWVLSLNDWSPLTKYAYVFNDSNKVTINEKYTRTNDEWTGNVKYVYTYEDDLKTRSSATTYLGWENNDWIPSNFIEYTYSFDIATSVTSSNWNNVINDWEPYTQNIKELDETGRVLSSINYSRDSSSTIWVNNSLYKTEYSYSTDGNTTTTINYKRENEADDFVFYSKSISEKNPENGFETVTGLSWSLINEDWVYESKTEYGKQYGENYSQYAYPFNYYPGFPYVRDYANYDWDSLNQEWIGTKKVVYSDRSSYGWDYQKASCSLDDSLLIIDAPIYWPYPILYDYTISEVYAWDSTASNWYITSGRKMDVTLNDEDKIALKEQYNWNSETGQHDLYLETEYFYRQQEVVGLLDENENSALNIYPNPASDVISWEEGLEVEQVDVYNNMGVLTNSYTGLTQSSVDVSGLEKGVYIIRVLTNEKAYESSFIKD